VFQIQQTEIFAKWLISLRDVRAKARILARLDSVRLGNLGDTKTVGDGVSEFRIDVGAGYRVYYTRRHRVVVILLCGGDKSTQNKDIVRAKLLARQLSEA
jgi:putative addiction module killer protein